MTPLDRSQAPTAQERSPFRLPRFERTTIGSLEILAYRRPAQPIANFSIIGRRAGGDYQQAPGIASLAAALLTEGTRDLTAVEFAEASEQLGGFLSAGADWDAAAVHAGSLSEHLDRTLELAAEAYLQPAFRSDDLERVRARRLSELARRSSDPASLASQALLQVLYEGTRYADQLIGTRTSLSAATASDLVDFWSTASRSSACLVAAGDVSLDRLESAARQWLMPLIDARPIGDGPATVAQPSEPAIYSDGLRVRIVDRADAAQTQLLLGHVGPGRLHADRPILRLLNAVFGGKFSSRINLNLRETHGFTYGASSSFSTRRGGGPFVVQAAVETKSTAESVRQVLHEIETIRHELVPTAELEDARSYLLGVQPYGLQTIEGWSATLGVLGVFDLESDFYDRQQEALARVTADEVRRAAQHHLQPEQLVAVVVGPKCELEQQFSDFDDVAEVLPS